MRSHAIAVEERAGKKPSLHCSRGSEPGEGKRGSQCGTLRLPPNHTPPCGAQTNRQPTAEVKD